MKRNIPRLLLASSCFFLGLASSGLRAESDPGNPWSPDYRPEPYRADTYRTPGPQTRPRHVPPPRPYYNRRPPMSYRGGYPGRAAPYYRRTPPPAYGAYPPPLRRPANLPPYGPEYGPSAFYMPGYNPRNDRWRNRNNFWGRSGPERWMHPSKENLEQGWDDMLNAPSRMGEMPGGWTAPSVSMPNPVDLADQFQENVKDLPEQIRDMDVGN